MSDKHYFSRKLVILRDNFSRIAKIQRLKIEERFKIGKFEDCEHPRICIVKYLLYEKYVKKKNRSVFRERGSFFNKEISGNGYSKYVSSCCKIAKIFEISKFKD